MSHQALVSYIRYICFDGSQHFGYNFKRLQLVLHNGSHKWMYKSTQYVQGHNSVLIIQFYQSNLIYCMRVIQQFALTGYLYMCKSAHVQRHSYIWHTSETWKFLMSYKLRNCQWNCRLYSLPYVLGYHEINVADAAHCTAFTLPENLMLEMWYLFPWWYTWCSFRWDFVNRILHGLRVSHVSIHL